MTGSDSARLYGICVTIWIPLNPRAAEDLERRCEEWRRDNMTDEERELATSLGERYYSGALSAHVCIIMLTRGQISSGTNKALKVIGQVAFCGIKSGEARGVG